MIFASYNTLVGSQNSHQRADASWRDTFSFARELKTQHFSEYFDDGKKNNAKKKTGLTVVDFILHPT